MDGEILLRVADVPADACGRRQCQLNWIVQLRGNEPAEESLAEGTQNGQCALQGTLLTSVGCRSRFANRDWGFMLLLH